MAESTAVAKQQYIDDSLSSDEWTIIEKKESKITEKEEKLSEPKETVIPEDTCQKEETAKLEARKVEEGEGAGEKDIDSDDISVISDENEEQDSTDFTFDRIEALHWEINESSLAQLLPYTARMTARSGPDFTNLFLALSAVIMIIGAIIAGQLLQSPANKPTTPADTDMNEKLKGMPDLEAKFKELSEVKQILDQLQTTMPDIKKLIDTLAHQKHESTKPVPDESFEIWKKFEKLYVQKLIDYHAYDDRLELLEDTYRNFCLTVKKINASNTVAENDLCKTPKALADMIEFKRSVKIIFGTNNSQKPSEKRVFTEAESKLDEISESMLSDLAVVFSKFTTKIEDRLNKFGYKLSKRVCSIYSVRAHDKLLTSIIEDEFFTKYCNDSLNDVILDSKVNISTRDEKDHEYKKKSYQESKKNNCKQDYQKVKDYNKFEDYSSEKEHSDENISAKSKGELKYDNNWKKNKYENKDKYFQEEKKYNKHENVADNYKNEYNKKTKEHFHESSYENKRENNHDRKFDSYKKERDNEHKHNHNKKDYEFKSQYKVDEIDDDDYENEDDVDYNKKLDKIKKQLDNSFKFDPNIGIDIPESRIAKKFKEFKDFKHPKYQAERKDKKDKYHHSGEWQMERGKAREKLRNSDWYFVRADLRRKARTDENTPKPTRGCDEKQRRNQRQKHSTPPPSSSSGRSRSPEWRTWRPRVWWASVKRNFRRFVPVRDDFF